MKSPIKCIVSVIDGQGAPELYFVKVLCSDTQYHNGDHYETAKCAAEDDGYETFVAYDENDSAGNAMLGLFEWESATQVEI